MVRRLESLPKNYEWGVVDGVSAFHGLPPSGLPEAEVWFGPHPLSECTIRSGEHAVPFAAWLEEEGHSFPLLVKVLAAAKPLSIQVHPDSDQARAGFDAEETRGIPQSDPQRTFRDPTAKPELIIAWSDSFEALWGVVSADVFEQRVEGMVATGLSPESAQWVRGSAKPDPGSFIQAVLAGDDRSRSVVAAVSDWAGRVDPALHPGDLGRFARMIQTLASDYPGDLGIALAIAMHVVSLARGEALFVPPGVPHAYLRGTGLEVMLPSDNVIRAGLTAKRVDADLFLRIADLAPRVAVTRVDSESNSGFDSYGGFAAPFRVHRVSGDSALDGTRASVLVIETGGFHIVGAEGRGELPAGSAHYVEAGEFPLRLEGSGQLWWVEPGEF